jgi:OPA family glycerol-3-phosphate transporter-like MFS transporter 1/2
MVAALADVGHVSPTNPHHHAHAHGEAAAAGGEPQDDSALGHVREGRPEPAVPFLTALRLPGVVTYSMCLFFSKLIAYTFLYWLPFYVGSTGATDCSAPCSLNKVIG